MLSYSASQILMRAVLQYIPDANILDYGTDRLGFFVEIDQPIQKEYLPRIKEKMQKIIKSGEQFQVMDMQVQHAKKYLRKSGIGRELPAKGVVQIAEIAGVADLIEEPLVEDLDALKFFDLIAVEEGRIHGVCKPGMKALKNWGKVFKSYSQKGAQALGEKQKLFLFLEEKILYLPKGERVRQALLKKVRDFYRKESVEEVSGLWNETAWEHFSNPVFTIMQEKNRREKGPFLALFSLEETTVDRFYFPSGAQKCNYLLKFIGKFLTLLSFEYQWTLIMPYRGKKEAIKRLSASAKELDLIEEYAQINEPVLVAKIEDQLGRSWEGPFLRIVAEQDVEGSLLGSLDRMIALLLESGKMKQYFEKELH